MFEEDESEHLRELLARVREGNEREVALVMEEYGNAVVEAKRKAARKDGEDISKDDDESEPDEGETSEVGEKGEQGNDGEEGEGEEEGEG